MPFWFAPAADENSLGDMWLFSTYEFVCLFGERQDGDQCFHSHNTCIAIELAVHMLIWCVVPFISVQFIGFGVLIKMIKINQSINMWSN